MRLTAQQLKDYKRDGLLILEPVFKSEELKFLHREISLLVDQDLPGSVMEEDSQIIRALHGCHLDRPSMALLTRQSRLLEPALQILKTQAYVHQFKINIKEAFGGDLWPWHQDFIFWNREDGMPAPEAVNLAIFLDEVNQFNGPLYLIPGSHRGGMIPVPPDGGTGWQANFSAKLKYRLTAHQTRELVNQRGIVSAQGPPGSVLIFDPNTVHGSVPNMSPYPRKMVIVTYNSVANTPKSTKAPRPRFLCSRDYRPLHMVSEEGLAPSLAVV